MRKNTVRRKNGGRNRLPVDSPALYEDRLAELERVRCLLNDARALVPLVLRSGPLNVTCAGSDEDIEEIAMAWAQTFPAFAATYREAKERDADALVISGALVGVQAGYLLGLVVGQSVDLAVFANAFVSASKD
ncbi:MAG: hypothetical protein AB7H96_12750 [Vicinamibacterales bacterium]